MQKIVGQVYRGLAWLFLAGCLVQVYLVGAALFGVTSLQTHRMLGFSLATLAIVLPVLALLGRMGRQQIILSTTLLVLTFAQAFLPMLREAAPWIAALHAVNALALIMISVQVARSEAASATLARTGGIAQPLATN